MVAGRGGGGIAAATPVAAGFLPLELGPFCKACLARDLPLEVGPNSEGEAGEMGEGLAELGVAVRVAVKVELEASRDGEGPVRSVEGTGRTQIRSRRRLCCENGRRWVSLGLKQGQ